MPPLLRYAWQAERWGALPYPGGLRDQPAGMLDRMAHVADVHRVYRKFWTAKDIAAASKQDPDGHTSFLRIERLLRDGDQ